MKNFLKAFLFSSVFMVNVQSKYKSYELNSVEIPCMWAAVPVNKTKTRFRRGFFLVFVWFKQQRAEILRSESLITTLGFLRMILEGNSVIQES